MISFLSARRHLHPIAPVGNTAPGQTRARPRLEALEDRCLLSAYMVQDINPGPAGSSPRDLLGTEERVFFVPNSSPTRLYLSDGTDAGTSSVQLPSTQPVSQLRYTNGMVFGRGAGNVPPCTPRCRTGDLIWRSDGTTAGTRRVEGPVYYIALTSLEVANNTLFFNRTCCTLKKSSDGVTTSVVRDFLGTGWWIGNKTEVGSTLFFTLGLSQVTYGSQLWKSDGTPEGTVLVTEVPSATNLTAVGETVFFTAGEETTGRELWKSDGTEAGTVLVKDINPGAADAFGEYSGFFTNINGTLYFSADDGQNGVELWRSDGTPEGTYPVADINPGPDGSYPAQFAEVNGLAYFAAFTSDYGYELWASDGTAEGTYLVADINPGPDGSSPGDLRNFNGVLFFTAEEAATGRELWASDGTGGGTVLVQDIFPGVESSGPLWLTVANGLLFFSADDSVNGRELWAYSFDPSPGGHGAGPAQLSFLASPEAVSALLGRPGPVLVPLLTTPARIHREAPGVEVTRGADPAVAPDRAASFGRGQQSGEGAAALFRHPLDLLLTNPALSDVPDVCGAP